MRNRSFTRQGFNDLLDHFQCHGRMSGHGPRSITATRFRSLMPDAEASISEEPGAKKRHAGICVGAVRATGRLTAMASDGLSIHALWNTMGH